MRSPKLVLFALVCCLLSGLPVSGAVIVEELTGDDIATGGPDNGLFYWGQLFITPAGGAWDHIRFNFFSDVPATSPAAGSEAFLLSQEYTGAPEDLDTSTPGFLAKSTGVESGSFVFPAEVRLESGKAYWVFQNAVPLRLSGEGDAFTSPFAFYFSADPSLAYVQIPFVSTNFRVSGEAVEGSAIPEPGTFWLLALAAAVSPLARRRRGSMASR